MDGPQSTPRPDRSHWPVRVYRLGKEPDDDLSASTTLTERLEMVWTLRDRMWELTGRPLPTYRRSEIPFRIIRP